MKSFILLSIIYNVIFENLDNIFSKIIFSSQASFFKGTFQMQILRSIIGLEHENEYLKNISGFSEPKSVGKRDIIFEFSGQ